MWEQWRNKVRNTADRRVRLRAVTIILCVFFAVLSMHLMMSWRFDLVLTLDVIITHSETVELSILDLLPRSEDPVLVYTVFNSFVLFSILAIVSPRFALVPPFLFLIAGWYLSEERSGDVWSVLEYSLETSGSMGYAIGCSIATLAIAVLANITMHMDSERRFHGLIYNVDPIRSVVAGDATVEQAQTETELKERSRRPWAPLSISRHASLSSIR